MQERAEAQVQDLSHRGPTNTPFTTSLAGSATSTASRAGSPPQIKTLRGLTQPPATPPPPSPQFPTRRSATAPAAASDSLRRRSCGGPAGYGPLLSSIRSHHRGARTSVVSGLGVSVIFR